MNTLLARYAALPRAARWGIWGGLAIILYFAAVEPIVNEAAALHAKAADMAAKLVSLDREAQTGQARVVATAAAKFGMPALPGDSDRTTAVFNTKVGGVLKQHGISKYSDLLRMQPMSQGPLTHSVGADDRVERSVAEIQFDATPEVVAAVVADLERTPEVSAVSRVQLGRADKDGGSRTLRATLAVEAWVITRKVRTR
jgi:hypothetical protein